MELDKQQNPRDLLKILKQRQTQRMQYEWRVHVHLPVEDVLAMVQNRSNPEWQAQRRKEPYSDTENFATLIEAQKYAMMVRLAGRMCSINNNWTGDVYEETC